MGKQYKTPLVEGWAGIYQAAKDFDQEIEEFIDSCNYEPDINVKLLPILTSLHSILLASLTLYKQYESYTYGEIFFAVSHAKSIVHIAWGLINLKPSDPENINDVKFAQIYIDFLERLKSLPNPPKIPSILNQILIIKLPELTTIENKDELFIQLCDKAIDTQHSRIAYFERNKSNTISIQNCSIYQSQSQNEKSQHKVAYSAGMTVESFRKNC